jgi:hypothetical protein
LLDVEAVGLESVLGRHAVTLLLVLTSELLSLLDHALDLVLRETSLVIGDRDLVLNLDKLNTVKPEKVTTNLLSSRLVLSRDVQNAVGVNVESDFDLRNTARGRWDAAQLELAQQVVVLCHGSLTFVDLNFIEY